MFSVKKFLIWLSPRKIYIPERVNIEKKWLGSAYGGFFVHLPALDANSTVLSFGIGEDISFDLSLLAATKAHIHAFDPTRGVPEFMQPHLEKYSNLSFSSFGLGAENSQQWFFPPENNDHVSCSVVPNETTKSLAYQVQMKKLSTIIEEKNISEIDLLKMDIEGAEYDVISGLLDEGIEVKQLLVEIHPGFFPDGRRKTRQLISKLNQFGFKIFGVSDTCRELSFIKL